MTKEEMMLELPTWVQKTFSISIPVVLIVTLFVLSGCTSTLSESSYGFTGKIPNNTANLSADIEIVQTTSALYADVDAATLKGQSDAVVVGTYLGASEPLLIRPVTAEKDLSTDASQYYTDLYFMVESELYGRVPSVSEEDLREELTSEEANILNELDKEIISARVAGGIGQRVAFINEGIPDFDVDESYLLFLYRKTTGADYNTGDTIYYPISESIGIWKSTESDKFIQTYGTDTVTLAELEAYSTKYGETATENDNTWDRYLAEYEEMYKQGQVSEESYISTKTYIDAIKERYAQILPEGDMVTYEEDKVSSGAISGSTA